MLSKSSCPNDLDISRHFLSASVLKHFSNSCLVRFGIHFSATFPDKNLRRNLELSSEPVLKASVGSGTAQNMACLNIAGLTCKKANMAEVWFEWFGWCEWCGQRNARAGCWGRRHALEEERRLLQRLSEFQVDHAGQDQETGRETSRVRYRHSETSETLSRIHVHMILFIQISLDCTRSFSLVMPGYEAGRAQSWIYEQGTKVKSWKIHRRPKQGHVFSARWRFSQASGQA